MRKDSSLRRKCLDIGYDRYTESNESNESNSNASDKSKTSDSYSTMYNRISMATITTIPNVALPIKVEEQLARKWIIDSGSDVHVCNNSKFSKFTETSKPEEGDIITSGYITHPVKS